VPDDLRAALEAAGTDLQAAGRAALASGAPRVPLAGRQASRRWCPSPARSSAWA
jgi:hypothetical protein